MAKIILGDKNIKTGYCVLVENLNPKFGASKRFMNIYLKFDQFKTTPIYYKGSLFDTNKLIKGFCLMFTEREHRAFFFDPYVRDPVLSSQNDTSFITNFPGPIGTMYQASIYGHLCFVGNIQWLNQVRCVKIPLRIILRAIKRSLKNKEDVTSPSFLTRVFGR